MSSLATISQVLCDLRWAVQSTPLLWDSVPATQLDRLDQNELEAFFKDQQPRQVGRYFEGLIEFWLTKIRKVEMSERGLQVQEENRTVGELDFVFRDEGGILTHWETAVKFYLHHEGEFIGPNATDTLERKVRHLKEHQIQLGQKAMPEIEKSEVLMKGRLYYHPDDGENIKLPVYVAANHLRGTWVRSTEMDRFDLNKNYYILEKPHWFTVPDSKAALSSSETQVFLHKHFQSSNRPLHLGNSIGQFVIVVDEKWPNI